MVIIADFVEMWGMGLWSMYLWFEMMGLYVWLL